jgi:hypothetical protein
LGHALIREPGSDPYVRADPVAVYVSGHDFDNGDINALAASMINCGFSRGCNWTAGDDDDEVQYDEVVSSRTATGEPL